MYRMVATVLDSNQKWQIEECKIWTFRCLSLWLSYNTVLRRSRRMRPWKTSAGRNETRPNNISPWVVVQGSDGSTIELSVITVMCWPVALSAGQRQSLLPLQGYFLSCLVLSSPSVMAYLTEHVCKWARQTRYCGLSCNPLHGRRKVKVGYWT